MADINTTGTDRIAGVSVTSGIPSASTANPTQVQNYNSGSLSANALGNLPAINTPVPPTPDAANLNNPSPLSVPNVGSTVTNSYAGISGAAAGANSGLQGMIDTATTDTGTAKGAVDTSMSKINDLMGQLAGKGAAQIQAENAAGIPQKYDLYKGLSNEYQTSELRYNSQYQEILNRPGGTMEQKNQEISALQRQNGLNLSNLAIRQSMASNDYNTAEQLVNHKIDLQFGDLKDQISYQMDFLKQNQDNLSTADKNKLQLQIELDTRKYNTATTDAKNLETAKLDAIKNAQDNGAPQQVLSAIQNAKDPQSALIAAGKYGGDALKKLQLEKARVDLKKAIKDGQSSTPIQFGTKEFGIAQDLAYGKLTFAQFKSLYSYSRDVSAKTNIYQKASELNPNFDPAQFELGFKFAANPKVRQQVSALDNVQAVIPSLLQHSDDAVRSNIPFLNKAIVAGGIAIGNSKYSNLEAARVAFADELSGALGFGSATDMSRQMGFDLTKTNLSPSQFSSAINDVVIPFIVQKRTTLINQMGVYGNDVNAMSGGGTGGTTPDLTNQFDTLFKQYGGK